jgi:mannosyl-oligosaccharide alpha-1,2-mannosidase
MLATSTTFSKVTKAVQASMDCSQQPPDQHTSTFFQTSGLWIKDGSYNLRPEVLESYYYAYRITNNPMYQDWAWDAFNAIQSNARLSQGFNVLGNVDIQGGDNTHGNNQESYFFAETLKYAYLIFSDDGPWQVNYQGRNDFVFNTEGHPIRIAS